MNEIDFDKEMDEAKRMFVLKTASLHKTIDELKKKLGGVGMNNYIKGNCTITWEELAEMQGKIVVDKVEYEELTALRAKLERAMELIPYLEHDDRHGEEPARTFCRYCNREQYFDYKTTELKIVHAPNCEYEALKKKCGGE